MTTNGPATSNKSLLSKIFRRGSKQENTDNTSTMSDTTLVPKERVKSISQEEYDTVSDLMAKANTMSEEDFKKYLKEHKEEVEDMYRKQGGGIASGEWISRDWWTGEFCFLPKSRGLDVTLAVMR